MRRGVIVFACAAASFLLASCGDGNGSSPFDDSYLGDAGTPFGEEISGQFHLGPADWEESAWTNSCGPYPAEIQSLEGLLLAGVGLDYNGDGQLCDACIYVETEAGQSAALRVVTTGVTNEPGDIDVSEEAYEALDSGEYPRAMTWRLVPCPDTGDIRYQFQTEANVWWTSLWVRNHALPIEKVEVRSANHAEFTELARGTDGTFTDASGFGEGAFTLRVTATTGEVIEDSFDGFEPGEVAVSPTGQFQD